MKTAKSSGRKIAVNRRARFDYEIVDTYEAGLVLLGTEVKSLRAGGASIREGYAKVENGEAWLINVRISEYAQGNRENHDPLRRRKLLLHRREIDRLRTSFEERGFTGVPLEMYFSDGRVKVVIGLGKGKKHRDKRQDAREQADKRDIERMLRRGLD